MLCSLSNLKEQEINEIRPWKPNWDKRFRPFHVIRLNRRLLMERN